MAEQQDDQGAGDIETELPTVPSPAPETIKVPDVELIIDGFGFMPKPKTGPKSQASRISSRRSSKAKTTSEHMMEEESPCASSTNIDIVRRYTWKTKNRMMVQVITYGATITVIKVPDKKGNPDDVIAGFDTLEEYFQPRNPYFGATIGRYANIIRDGTFVVRPSGRMYMVSTNKEHNHYHGGYIGFDKVNWRSYVVGNKVIMSHVSDRFHEGYPGTVMAQVSFEVTCDNTIKIEMKCTTSEPTIINLSQAPFFNLAGHHAGHEVMYDHIFTVNADKYTVADDEGLVTGEKKVVGGTAYDFRVPRSLRTMLPRIPMGGYDVNFCITQGIEQDLTFQSRVLHPWSGRVLEVYSNQPGMQFYTGNLLPDPDKIYEEPSEEEEGKAEDELKEEKIETESEKESHDSEEGSKSEESSIQVVEEVEEEEDKGSQGKEHYGYVPLMGKDGTTYRKHGLFCMMPQNYPDACNHWDVMKAVAEDCLPGHNLVLEKLPKFSIKSRRSVRA